MTSSSDLTRHFWWSPRAAGAHPRTTTRPSTRATGPGTQRTPRGNAPAPGARRPNVTRQISDFSQEASVGVCRSAQVTVVTFILHYCFFYFERGQLYMAPEASTSKPQGKKMFNSSRAVGGNQRSPKCLSMNELVEEVQIMLYVCILRHIECAENDFPAATSEPALQIRKEKNCSILRA